MHGFLRMYWAKKILEWTATPAEALRIAIFLNDKCAYAYAKPMGWANAARRRIDHAARAAHGRQHSRQHAAQ